MCGGVDQRVGRCNQVRVVLYHRPVCGGVDQRVGRCNQVRVALYHRPVCGGVDQRVGGVTRYAWRYTTGLCVVVLISV